MRKRLMSILLCLVMLFSLVPGAGVTASAADGFVEVSTYEQLKTAVDKGDAKVKLMANIDTTNENGGAGVTDQTALKFIGNKNILDLNGYTLKLVSNTGATFFEVLKSLTIKDSGTGGRIDFEWGSSVLHRTTAIHVADASTVNLTVESGTLSSTYRGVTLIESEGNLTIKGGKIQVPDEASSHDNAKAIYTDNSYGDNCKILISGGEISGNVMFTRDDSAVAQIPKGSECPIQISGGTFKGRVRPIWQKGKEPSEKITEYSPVMEISGGTFEGRFADRFRGNLPVKLTGGTFKQTSDFYMVELGPKPGIEYSAFAESLGNSIIMRGNEIRTACYWSRSDWFYLDSWISLTATESDPVTVIPNAWGMKSVTLDGTKTINYAKDWYGAVEKMDNSKDHTLTFEWYPLASALVNAGYSYNAKCEHYISGSTAVQQTDTIAADKTSHTITIPAGADPKVYSYDLQLNLQKGGSSVGILVNQHIVKLVVNEAPPAPPEPVAHSIKIINGFGTATPSTAMAGDTVTVKAKDRTADNMMFTQWYTETAGVTFADVTKQETTFVMPDCNVVVNPGYHGVSFTNQPTDSWLSSVDDSKVYFAFSQPITSWKLVNEDDTTLASGDAESANALVAATLGPKPDKTEMTCRVIVTANGQNFTSRTFDLKWYNVPGAPDVTVYPAGGKFVETLEVNLKTPNTYWWILYTTDGSDPYDKSGTEWAINPRAKVENDSTQVTISKDTTIKACLYNPEGYSNMEKFGDIVTCNFTKVELTPPVADPPSGTSFYDRLNVSLSTDIVNAKIMLSYNDGDVNDLSDPNQWKEYEPEKESITLSGSYGMHGFDAVTGILMEHPDGYTYWVHSDKQEYLYPRISYADIADASVTGIVNEKITPTDVSITLHGDVFAEYLTAGEDVSSWFTNLPDGLKATVKEKTNYTATLVITISGTPTAASAAAISVEMPKSALRYTGTGTAVEQTVLSNPKAVYNIGTDAAHTHDYTGQPYLYLDPGNHYRECKAGDGGLNIEAHTFGNWMPNSDGTTQSRICTKCKHTETASISMYSVTVTTDGNGTAKADKTSAVAGTVVTLTATPDTGYRFKQWQVVTGGVTIKDSKFTMPAGNVEVKAIFEKDATPPAPTVNPFVDVPAGSFYYDAVLWAVEKGVTTGTSATTFEPDGSCTRAQAVTFLWRVAGCPAPKSAAMPFTDVKAGSFYYDAVLWAVENGITKGTSETTFEPEGICTRAQIVTLIWRCMK